MSVYIQHCYAPDRNASKSQIWLCQIMNQSGINQAELAKKLHTTRQAVSKLLNNHTRLTFDKVCSICYVLGLENDPEEVWQELNADEISH